MDSTHGRRTLIFCEDEGTCILDVALVESAKLEHR